MNIIQRIGLAAQHDVFTLTSQIHPDDDNTPPWLRADGHGTVTEQRCQGRPHKSPGQIVLHATRHTVWLYDFQDACRQARLQQWDCAKTRHQAAQAARKDFELLQGWCRDDWSYIGVQVKVVHTKTEIELAQASLWGIESFHNQYIIEVANELALDAIDNARRTMRLLAQS